jgi:hypothetical protein
VTKLRASDGALLGTFNVGKRPTRLAFDGTNIWVLSDGTLTKLRASDGTLLGTFPASYGPVGYRPFDPHLQCMTCDGANMWVTNISSKGFGSEPIGTVSKLRCSDGALQSTFSVEGKQSRGLVFDGANIWVASAWPMSILSKIRASDGVLQGRFDAGLDPQGITFDGTNIWVTINNDDPDYPLYSADDCVTKLRASDGALLGTFKMGMRSCPSNLVFDGANIWVTNSDNILTKLRASDGALLGTFNPGFCLGAMTCDGANIWMANSRAHTVTKLRCSDGALQGSAPVGHGPEDIISDGSNIWVASYWQYTFETTT